MTVKEYLSQAYRIDQRINSKLEQVPGLGDQGHLYLVRHPAQRKPECAVHGECHCQNH